MATFLCCIIKTVPSDAELREDQDGIKQMVVREMMAELCTIFHLYVAKKMKKEMKTTHAKEGNFPCKLRWLGPLEQEFNGE